jgi:hypothetical protein
VSLPAEEITEKATLQAFRDYFRISGDPPTSEIALNERANILKRSH